ncbi:MAG: adenosylmethionine--8-amino-7-oxononanoate transaminase [Candidatus Cloacimonadota bacterium]|nr:MAG: adenosylmethionine--8-amino-7-oxononanoate transaminase [Candidatus Cloacimonadota bacterium]
MKRYKLLKEKSDKNLWYPFSQMQGFVEEEYPVIESGEGVFLTDVNGKKYIDGVASIWTNVHGHNHPELNKAMKEQIDKISHTTMLGVGNVPAIELAEKLIEITPENLTKVFYSDSGSEAVEIALKIAYQYNQQNGKPEKKKFISFKNAYHGDTIGSVSAGGIDLFHKVYGGLIFETVKADSPFSYRLNGGMSEEETLKFCSEQLEEIMKNGAEEIGALVIEPLVQGAGGLIVHPKGFLAKVRELCSKYDILMICDEVAVGFGKTGTLFACEQENVKPDLMAVAKGISAGYLPLAATFVTEKIYRGFLGKYEDFRTFFHGHTFTGNPVACAAALANLELFRKNNVLENVKLRAEQIAKAMKKLADHPNVGDIRQCGMMVGAELVKDKASKEEFEPALRIGHQVTLEARKNGAIIRPLGNVIILMPPLVINERELETLLNVTVNAICKVTKKSI